MAVTGGQQRADSPAPVRGWAGVEAPTAGEDALTHSRQPVAAASLRQVTAAVPDQAVLNSHGQPATGDYDIHRDRGPRGVLECVGQCLGDDPAGDLGRGGVHVRRVVRTD
jgi:hypothetical protein